MGNKPSEITHLGAFTELETFVRLFDRLAYIEKQINQVKILRQLILEPTFSNVLQTHGVDFFNMTRVYTEHVHFSYRSMFQKSRWEKGIYAHISPSAYDYNDGQLQVHNEIISHVNTVIGHQDIDGNNRMMYPPITDKNGEEKYAMFNHLKYHVDSLESHINSMKKAINSTSSLKFGKTLVLF